MCMHLYILYKLYCTNIYLIFTQSLCGLTSSFLQNHIRQLVNDYHYKLTILNQVKMTGNDLYVQYMSNNRLFRIAFNFGVALD